ncbi:sulfotransferase [Methylomonas sp. MgM2]
MSITSMQQVRNIKLKRNDPCPCGSGKKVKACCGAYSDVAQDRVPDAQQLLQLALRAVANRDVEGATAGFRAVLKVRPKHAEALAGLGQALCWQDYRREGLAYLQQAARILEKGAGRNHDVKPLLELAEQLHHWGDVATSVRLAKLAVKLSPDAPAPHNNLALYLMRINRLEEALPHARKSGQLLSDDPAPQNLLAALEARLGEAESAKERLETVISDNRNPRQTARAWQELATISDKLGDYAGAFAASRKAKTLNASFAEFRALDGRQLFDVLERNRAGFSPELLGLREVRDYADDLPVPIFLMGFLRSGTTLTEQVLAAHPQVMTSDENGIINQVAAQLGRLAGCGGDTAAGLASADLSTLLELRRYYWHRVQDEYGAVALRKTFVNKVALNSIDIGLIACLFPEAKIIFALRDPRDVCLSCFMQSFQPSVATINMLSWQGTAKQYAAIMNLWLQVRDHMRPTYLQLRYEDAVNDFEKTFRAVFAFLGLDWSAEIIDFHARMKGRYIATPSFAAVSQPVYDTAVRRWTRYREHLEEIQPVLQPFIDVFAYGGNG